MTEIKEIGRRFFVRPIVALLMALKIHPNVITVASLGLAIIAFFFYKGGVFWAGAIFLFWCGVFDSFDGEIARRRNLMSKLGSFLDSTVDRVNEFIIYFGLYFYYFDKESYIQFWILVAIFGSMMVSYTRARAEGLGISPQVGIFERFTRIVLLIVGSVLGPRFMPYVIIILAVGTIQTTLQRIVFVKKRSFKD
ncbi:MAG: CDP-alcohol phosphatidyltransferase family protein [candidate division WOR-3 bacterium]|nr:MAG: CDP-alcohol phosphatidyltransferase family protein [candidate division WOR-3 bacterium]